MSINYRNERTEGVLALEILNKRAHLTASN